MAMPLPTEKGWTLETVHALPEDGNRYELLDGELLVSPAPSLPHQRAQRILGLALGQYLELLGGYEIFFTPTAVLFSERRELQPDLLIARMVDGRKVGTSSELKPLVLAVEILSPSTARNDRYKKRAAYQQEGTGEFWIVDQPARLIERWRPEDAFPVVETERLVWMPEGAAMSFTLDLPQFFDSAAGP